MNIVYFQLESKQSNNEEQVPLFNLNYSHGFEQTLTFKTARAQF